MFPDGKYRVVKIGVAKRNAKGLIALECWFSDTYKPRWRVFGVGMNKASAMLDALQKFSAKQGIDPARLEMVARIPDGFSDYEKVKTARDMNLFRGVKQSDARRS